MVAPDHRRPAFGRDGVEFLLAHPQVADPATWMSWVRLMDSQLLGGTQSTFVGLAVRVCFSGECHRPEKIPRR